MRTIVTLFMVLMLTGAAWAGESNQIYLPNDDNADEWLVIEPVPTIVTTGGLPEKEIADILTACLEFIEDGSIDRSVSLTPAMHYPVTRDVQMYEAAARAQRETALQKRIKEMITKLKGESK